MRQGTPPHRFRRALRAVPVYLVALIGFALATTMLVHRMAPTDTVSANSREPLLLSRCERAPNGYLYASAVPISTGAAGRPQVTASAVAVIDGETGRTLLDLNAHGRRAPASTTKMLTAALTLEHGGLDRTVVSETDARSMVDSSVMGLFPGSSITIRDLLYGLLLPSGNDAAIELSRAVAGSESAFVDLMNKQVGRLGLTDTHFQNPHGLDAPGQYSSPYDLAMIARYAMSTPGFADIDDTVVHHLPPPFDYDLNNGNTLLTSYPGADGVKVGWTDQAGWTFVASATRDGHRVFVALMGTQARDADAIALFDWAWRSYRWVNLDPALGYGLSLATHFGIGNAAVDSIFGACS